MMGRWGDEVQDDAVREEACGFQGHFCHLPIIDFIHIVNFSEQRATKKALSL